MLVAVGIGIFIAILVVADIIWIFVRNRKGQKGVDPTAMKGIAGLFIFTLIAAFINRK